MNGKLVVGREQRSDGRTEPPLVVVAFAVAFFAVRTFCALVVVAGVIVLLC
jgi:hypothetical protein